MSTSQNRLAESGKSFCTEENLKTYLSNKSAFSSEEQKQLKYYIDNFSDCWKTWNKVRWDAAMNSQGVQELKEYLGDKFVPYYDSSWGLAEEWNSKLRDSKDAVEQFYKNTKNYIYNSLIFDESGNRDNFHDLFLTLKNRYHIESVTDYGCGVGNDGLRMLEEGTKVTFTDFHSPTLDFLKWRLIKRDYPKSQYKVIELEHADGNNLFTDMFWSIDVIEHMINPLEIFKFIGNETRLVVYYTDSDDKAGGRHPFHFHFNSHIFDQEFKKKGFVKVDFPILNVWLKK